MPEADKRVYTYDQLDSILRRRGTKQEKPEVWMARLRSTVHVSTTYTGLGLALRHVSSEGDQQFEFARVFKVAGGDTLYRVYGLEKEKARNPDLRKVYRRAVRYFTPRDIAGKTPTAGNAEWFRVRNGAAQFVPSVETFPNGEPRNCWLGFHSITRPAIDTWLNKWKEQHPRLCKRAHSFYVRLRRALKDGLPCTVQVIKPSEVPSSLRYAQQGPALHVCVPPTERGPTKRLVLVVANYDLDSRRHFGVDGDFGHRHAQVWGAAVGGGHTLSAVASKEDMCRWRSTREAIVGVQEWIMGSIHIPGF